MKFLKSTPIVSYVFLALLGSCAPDMDLYEVISQEEPLLEQINSVSSVSNLILPDNLISEIPFDPKNTLTDEKMLLGKMLFHETDIALAPLKTEGLKTYSCASCHHAKAGFQSGMKQAIGEGGFGFGNIGETRLIADNYDASELDVQPIRSPTILNSAYQDVMLWNGQFGATKTNAGTEANWTEDTPIANNLLGFEGVETQAIAGLDVHRLEINPEQIINSAYKELFDNAYPDISVEDRYTQLNGALAIAAYERCVVASEAPFQKWLRGDTAAMDENQKKGALLFYGKGQCYTCHSGPGMNGMDFHALGMNNLSGDDIHLEPTEQEKLGRGGFTKNPDDEYAFKTPTLYNLKGLKFLGHGGSFSSVEEVIRYKNIGVAENSEVPEEKLDELFIPLGLTDEEIELLTYFVETGLYDADLSRYVPDSLPSEACFPNADTQSKIDMGCN